MHYATNKSDKFWLKSCSFSLHIVQYNEFSIKILELKKMCCKHVKFKTTARHWRGWIWCLCRSGSRVRKLFPQCTRRGRATILGFQASARSLEVNHGSYFLWMSLHFWQRCKTADCARHTCSVVNTVWKEKRRQGQTCKKCWYQNMRTFCLGRLT